MLLEWFVQNVYCQNGCENWNKVDEYICLGRIDQFYFVYEKDLVEIGGFQCDVEYDQLVFLVWLKCCVVCDFVDQIWNCGEDGYGG